MLKASAERIARDIEIVSQIKSGSELGFTRLSFSEEDRRAREHIKELMEKEANLDVRTDAAGNLFGRRIGKTGKPVILTGSHIDTVRGGGRFDGVAGVVASLEVARRLEELQVEMIHPFEVVIFLAEEPSPYGISTIGSRVVAGKLTEEEIKRFVSEEGKTLSFAIKGMGGDPAKLSTAIRSPGDILAYLELHIEQGPTLDTQDIPVGIVTGIVGIWRGHVTIIGESGHSGTTPMQGRKDALTAAAQAILALEESCLRVGNVVGTFGKLRVYPDSLNVIPGAVNLGMEIRSLEESYALEAISLFERKLQGIRDERGVSIECDIIVSSKPVIFDVAMRQKIEQVCEELCIPHIDLASGAGHDASHIACLAPTGMIFVPSKAGRSHCPEEWTDSKHIALGAEVLAGTALILDKE